MAVSVSYSIYCTFEEFHSRIRYLSFWKLMIVTLIHLFFFLVSWAYWAFCCSHTFSSVIKKKRFNMTYCFLIDTVFWNETLHFFLIVFIFPKNCEPADFFGGVLSIWRPQTFRFDVSALRHFLTGCHFPPSVPILTVFIFLSVLALASLWVSEEVVHGSS